MNARPLRARRRRAPAAAAVAAAGALLTASPVAAADPVPASPSGSSATPSASGSPSAGAAPRVRGAADCAGAPVLRPGRYRDALDDGTGTHYRLSLPPGRGLRATAVVTPDGGVTAPSAVDVRIRQADGGGKQLAAGDGTAAAWGDVASGGAETGRLGWDRLTAGHSALSLCVAVTSHVEGSGQPADLVFTATGRALTAADLPAPGTGGDGTSGGNGDGGTGDGAGTDGSGGGSGRPVRQAASSSGPDTGLVTAMAAVGLAGGGVLRVVVARRRKGSRS